MKKLIGFALVALIIAGVIVWRWPAKNQTPMNASPSSSASTSSQSQATESSLQLVIGNPGAKATIIEYGDYKCPSCNQFIHGAEIQIKKDFIDTGRAKLIFRNLPYINEDSFTAAEGSFCAAAQNKFSEYHYAVYNYMWDNYYKRGNTIAEFQNILTIDKLTELAAHTGINSEAFKTCLSSGAYKENVTADLKASEADDVIGTPTFIIGGQKVTGPQGYAVFKPLIELQLK